MIWVGLGLIFIGILFSATLVGALFGIPIGFIGFIVLIAGLIMSDGRAQQQPAGFIPPQNRPIPQQVTIPTRIQAQQSTDSKFCVSCGSKIPNSYTFCNVCGAPAQAQTIQQPESKFCVSCGTKMPNASGFCPSCGSKQP